MIRLDVEQGSPEWIKARLGIPTASQFHRIITPKRMELAAGSVTYRHELIAERLLDASLDPFVSELMERGAGLEEQAVAYYELHRDLDTEKVGHCLTDDKRCGCSPDRLVGDEGGLEIKCPGAAIHVGYMLGIDHRYRAQIQGSLWITDRRWWDWLSFHPELPPVLIRQYRDDVFIEKLTACLGEFHAALDLDMATAMKVCGERAAS